MIIKLNLVNIPAQQAVIGSSFTPILGQYGVSIRDFCNLFNTKTKIFFESLPVNLILIFENKNIYFQNIKISPSFFVNYYIYKNKIITLKDIFLFLILELKSANLLDHYLLFQLKLKSLFKSKIAYVKSFGYYPVN